MKISPVIKIWFGFCGFIALMGLISGKFQVALVTLGVCFGTLLYAKLVDVVTTPPKLTPEQQERQDKIDELKRLGKPFCMKCLGTNIQFAFVTTSETSTGTIESKKRSLAERTVNKTGRGLANMATMGLYGAVTPKKGKYKEYTSSTTTVHSQKMALCQDCGNSWKVK